MPLANVRVKHLARGMLKFRIPHAPHMAEKPDSPANMRTSFDPSIQTEDIAFSSDEMVSCECGRMSPPNRFKCLYCGRDLDIRPDKAGFGELKLRRLEMWERGFNVVFLDHNEDASIDTGSIAAFLSLETKIIDAIFSGGLPLPLVRVESEKEADTIGRGLEQMGLNTMIVSDVDLASDRPPTRLSGMVFEPDSVGLRAFNTGDMAVVPTSDLVVLVSGSIETGRVEAVEKKRRGSTEIIDEAATRSDEAILDIYARGYPLGFRVNLAGFDFSCLGPEKGLLAVENMTKLSSALRTHAPGAAFVDDYQKARPFLGDIWEVDIKRSPTGLQRSAFARRDYGSVTSSSNLDQFTRYSRLQRHLYESKR